ncbi:MAG: hypothetical protein Q4B68_06145 [Bacteroidales bacterium]|nr:hypothetical protein [Bacteroidales bacterium]
MKCFAWYEDAAALKAVTALFRQLPSVQDDFARLSAGGALHPEMYMPLDVDGDGRSEIWVRTHSFKAGILYAVAPDGGLVALAEDTEAEDVVIKGNLVTIARGKHADVSEARLIAISRSQAVEADFVEQRSYDGATGKDVVQYLTRDGKKASGSHTRNFFSGVKPGAEFTEQSIAEGNSFEILNRLGEFAQIPDDVTVSEHPIFVSAGPFAKNVFFGIKDGDVKDPSAYTKMIFKPHIGDVKYSHKDGDGDWVFKLKNPALVKKMFRGYQPLEATPIIVKESWLKGHTTLQFSRWKDGEKREQVKEQWMIDAVEKHYGRKLKSLHWIADVPTAERHFYVAVFEHEDISKAGNFNALGSLVCFAEGELVSSFDFWGSCKDGEAFSVWRVDDDGEFIWPEISLMVAGNDGFEIYFRHPGPEGAVLYCVREIGNQFIKVYGNSQYWGGN